MGTEFLIAIHVGVFPVELQLQPAKFQCSTLQIGQDSSIYILDVILGRVYDVISRLICIFFSLIFQT